MPTDLRWIVSPFLLIAAALGCSSGGDGGGTGPGDPTGSIAISVNPGTLSLEQGENGQISVTLSRSGGFGGAVTLTGSGAPSGVIVGGGSIGASSSSVQLDVSVGGSSAPGTSTITITASGSGVTNATATFSLTVTEAPVPAFSLSLSDSNLSIQQGADSDLTVTISRSGGFTGDVVLSASGLPGGAIAAFEPGTVSGTSSTLTVSVGSGVAVGSYTVTVTGSGTGVSDASATFTLGVSAGSGGGGMISFGQCYVGGVIDWMAFQDGNGPWTPVAPVAGEYSFDLTNDRGAVAVVQAPGGSPNITILHLTAEEMAVLSQGECFEGGEPRTVTGSVAGLDANDFANVTLGTAQRFLTPAAPDFTFTLLPQGPLNLLASQYSNVPPALDKIIIRRNLNPAHNDVLPVLDFGAAEAVAPVVNDLTINNIQGETTSAVVSYVLDDGNTGSLLYSEPEVSANPDRTYRGVPASLYQAGDYHRLSAQATSADLTTTRSIIQFFGQATDRTLTLPDAIGPTPVTVAASAPYARLRLQYTPQPQYDSYYLGYFTQSDGIVTRTVVENFSAGYLDGESIDFTFPDFSGLTGWDDAWGLQAGHTVTASFNANGWPGEGGISIQVFEGGEIQTGARVGMEITP